MDKKDEIVEGLDALALKGLAKTALHNLEKQIIESIEQVADIRRRFGKNAEEFMKIAVVSYEQSQVTLQKYGLWNEKYQDLYKVAREEGTLDLNILKSI